MRETYGCRKNARLMRQMLKVLTAYSAFKDSFGSVNIAGRLGLSRGKERKILLSSAAIWLIYSYLRFQSPDKKRKHRTNEVKYRRFSAICICCNMLYISMLRINFPKNFLFRKFVLFSEERQIFIEKKNPSILDVKTDEF